MEKQLYRSRNNKVLAGVCGGIAEYFDIDPSLVRIICFISFFTGAGVIAYIVCAVIIPEGSYNNYEIEEKKNYETSPKNRLILGYILVAVGVGLLAEKYFYWFDLEKFWPIILIALGASIIFKKEGK